MSDKRDGGEGERNKEERLTSTLTSFGQQPTLDWQSQWNYIKSREKEYPSTKRMLIPAEMWTDAGQAKVKNVYHYPWIFYQSHYKKTFYIVKDFQMSANFQFGSISFDLIKYLNLVSEHFL